VEVGGPFKIEGKPYTITVPERRRALWAKKSSGLIGRWKFDETSGTVAHDSTGVNNGTVHGARWTSGKFGGALDFDGTDDYVSINQIGEFDALTIAMWINIDTLSGENNLCHVDGWREGIIHFLVELQQLHFSQLLEGGAEIEEKSDFMFSKDKFGQWHHAAVAYDSIKKTLGFYVDGKLDKLHQFEKAQRANLDSFRIACHDITMNCFDGRIDDVQIYDYALSADDIAAVYAGKEITEPRNWIPVLVIIIIVVVIVGLTSRKKKHPSN
jgi:hypothetical protein